jgi:hypothetical protein
MRLNISLDGDHSSKTQVCFYEHFFKFKKKKHQSSVKRFHYTKDLSQCLRTQNKQHEIMKGKELKPTTFLNI